MSKLKTSKSASKRFKRTSTGKLMRRTVNVGHFNAKMSGNERRGRQSDQQMSKANLKDVEHMMPYIANK
jgi:large subunit ribosomal protein L35